MRWPLSLWARCWEMCIRDRGKTTTTHMIKSVLEAAGRKVGMIGTNGIYFLGRHQETANTTPESYELQKTFREFLDAGCDTALMEVSSQGLMMDRVAGIHYDIGVFTNLSPDHIGPGEHKTLVETGDKTTICVTDNLVAIESTDIDRTVARELDGLCLLYTSSQPRLTETNHRKGARPL